MKKILKLLEFLIALFIILNCRSVFMHTVNKNYQINKILVICIIVAIIVKFIIKDIDIKKMKKFILYICIYFLYSIIFILCNNIVDFNTYVNNFFIFFLLFFGYYYISKDTKETILNILKNICNIMVIIAVISIIIYFLGPILNIIKPTKYIYMEWGKERAIPSYFNIHFVTQSLTFFGHNLVRNTSIFTEAPMYSLNLIIALSIQSFILENKSIVKEMILIAATITTISTTGILLVIIIIIVNVMFNKKLKITKYILFPFIFLFGIMLSLNVFNERAQSTSGTIRKEDFMACFSAWKENLLFGTGYSNQENIEKYIQTYKEEGRSSSLMLLLAQGGIYLFILYFIPIYKGIKYSLKISKIKILFFILILCILFVVAIFTYTAMAFSFIAMGYALSNKDYKLR